jgi:hypothetical protein
MAKRRRKRARDDAPAATHDYTDDEGSVLTLRDSLSAATIAKVQRASARGAGSPEDDWQRRTELLFERLAVGWEIAGLPLTDQRMLLGRYRMADEATRRWVQRTLADHVERHIPELAEPGA